MKWYETFLSRAPLPLLALSAAWGVWSFQSLFVPWFVAALSALAFESVYLSLAFVPTRDSRRATAISVTAVAVSVVYNALSSLFHIRPALLLDRPLWSDIALALLHGAPLAIVAYAVADLLLHTTVTPAPVAAPEAVTVTELPAPAPAELPAPAAEAPVDPPASKPLSKSARVKLLAEARGVSESTIWRAIKNGEITLA